VQIDVSLIKFLDIFFFQNANVGANTI